MPAVQVEDDRGEPFPVAHTEDVFQAYVRPVCEVGRPFLSGCGQGVYKITHRRPPQSVAHSGAESRPSVVRTT
jgi:hypothetical protein